MTVRDNIAAIRKADRRNYKDDAASAALGAGGGAAAMPMRSPHARGLRQIDNQNVWNAAEKAGGRAGGKIDVDIDPNQFARISQQKGKRLFNAGYTAEAARAHQKGEFKYPENKRYTLTAYKDAKGRVELRQQDGRHMGEVHAMQGKKVPATIHMVEGNIPAEDSAVKAVLRPLSSAVQRRRLARNVNLSEGQISEKAKKYPKVADRVNRDLVQRYGHNPGTDKVDLPWKHGKDFSHLKRKQAAYVAGGAAAMWGANKATEKISGKGVGMETIKLADKTSDKAREFTATAIDPHRSIRKTLYLNTEHMKSVDAQARKNVGYIPKGAPVNANGYPLVLDEEVRRINGTQGKKWKPRQKKRLSLVSKASDNTERTAAGATGATAGVMLMPMRDKIGKNPKKFAQKYKDIPEGTHQMRLPSSDLQTIAAPGVREKVRLWRDKKTNIDYTTKMAAKIHSGAKVGDGEKPRIAIYDDAARVTGGQHRVHANAWSGMKDQDVEVVRMKGYYGGVERGHKAIRTRVKRAVYPKMFMNANPKDTNDLLERAAKIPENDKRVAHAKKNATDTARATLHPAMTKKQLRLLKGKQAAYIAGGAGAAVGARELYRRNVG